jgi:hypothetical protein
MASSTSRILRSGSGIGAADAQRRPVEEQDVGFFLSSAASAARARPGAVEVLCFLGYPLFFMRLRLTAPAGILASDHLVATRAKPDIRRTIQPL